MRQILCVVDFTESAGSVLEVAALITKACGARLIVLFPYRLIINGFQGDIPSLKSKLETEAKEKFAQLKKNFLHDVSCEFVSEIGFTADRIEAHAKGKHISMVVIGQQQTIATNDIKTFNLQKLIANSRLPFLIVPAEVSVEANSEA